MLDWRIDPRPIAELLPIWETLHGWSGAEAARQLDAPYLTYRDWRTGRRKPSPETMLRRLMTLIDRLPVRRAKMLESAMSQGAAGCATNTNSR